MENCALSEDDELYLKKHIESKGCIFLSTPFSRAAFERLEKLMYLLIRLAVESVIIFPY